MPNARTGPFRVASQCLDLHMAPNNLAMQKYSLPNAHSMLRNNAKSATTAIGILRTALLDMPCSFEFFDVLDKSLLMHHARILSFS